MTTPHPTADTLLERAHDHVAAGDHRMGYFTLCEAVASLQSQLAQAQEREKVLEEHLRATLGTLCRITTEATYRKVKADARTALNQGGKDA